MKRKIAAVFLTATMLGLFSSCSQSVSGESQEAMVDAVQEDTEEQSAEVTMSPEESSISDRSRRCRYIGASGEGKPYSGDCEVHEG